MESGLIVWFARWLATARTRRTSLGGGVLALIAVWLTQRGASIEARKRKRRKKRKKKNSSLSSCATLCGVNCGKCLYRADAGPLCGDGIETSCLNCGSDADCVEPDRPFCISHFEDRVSGDISKLCGPGSVCGCDPAALGVCSDVFVCGSA